jgi:hypothetical protein
MLRLTALINWFVKTSAILWVIALLTLPQKVFFRETAATLKSYEVVSSTVRSPGDRMAYTYEYEIAGKRYLGWSSFETQTRYYNANTDGYRSEVKNWKQTHPVGSKLVVWYHVFFPAFSSHNSPRLQMLGDIVTLGALFWTPVFIIFFIRSFLSRGKRKRA